MREKGNKTVANGEQEECLLPQLPWPCWASLLKHLHLPMECPAQGTVPSCSLFYSTAWPSPALWKARSAGVGRQPSRSACSCCILKGLAFMASVPSISYSGLPKKTKSHLLQGKFRYLCCFPVWSVEAELTGYRQREGKGGIPASRWTVSLRHHCLWEGKVRMGSKTTLLST